MTFLQIRIRLRSNIEVLPAFSALAQQEYPPQKFLTPESIIGIRGFFRVKENLCVQVDRNHSGCSSNCSLPESNL